MKGLDKELKMPESDFGVTIRMDIWRPSREWIDYFFSMNAFTIRPNGNSICTFYSLSQTDSFSTVEITVFCKKEDEDYLQTQIKNRKEVNK